MTATYPISIVDVFAEQPLSGNQLAVVHQAASLSSRQMQAIALETNYSETTFVLAQDEGSARVRIFTPVQELPFAGHPTVGTAWVLSGGSGQITLELGVGPVTVEFADGIGWMTPPEVAFTGSLETQLAADLVNLDTGDLSTRLPLELAEVGPKFLLLPVKDLAALRAARLNADLHARLVAEGLDVQCVFLFSEQPYADGAVAGGAADYAARMFFNSGGIREDPATGSANTAFAAYLRKHLGLLGEVTVDQGVEIGRPSRLYLRVQDTLQVGGRVQPVIEGTLTV